ncbi:hypothetical protein B0H12DRAFT_1109700 [Mycena haematopus]|nr:hypothetical protein B0H12DRAFT_1109700 [Mycena haematopus]
MKAAESGLEGWVELRFVSSSPRWVTFENHAGGRASSTDVFMTPPRRRLVRCETLTVWRVFVRPATK